MSKNDSFKSDIYHNSRLFKITPLIGKPVICTFFLGMYNPDHPTVTDTQGYARPQTHSNLPQQAPTRLSGRGSRSQNYHGGYSQQQYYGYHKTHGSEGYPVTAGQAGYQGYHGDHGM